MDPFDCSAPQFVPNLRDAADNLDADGADEFFDIPESSFENKENICMTPKNRQPPLKEQFYTPMVVEESGRSEPDEPETAAEPAVSEVTSAAEQAVPVETSPAAEQAIPVETSPAAEQAIPVETSPAAEQTALGAEIAASVNEPEQRAMKEAKRRSIGSTSRKVRVFDGLELPPEKNHQMTTRQDEPRRALKRKISQMPSSNIHDVKKTRSSLAPKNKYLSMAEMIIKFQKDTPPRYRSRPSTASNDKTRLKITMAQSPKLLAKLRTRIPVAEPKENPSQFSAKPVDKSIFKKPITKKPPARPSTVPEPFHLTETKPKATPKTEEVFVFKARPAPITAGMSDINPDDSLESILSTKSRSTRYQGIKTVDRVTKETVPKPFSFEERDRKRREEKEAKIKQMIEQESKVPKFRATPAPSFATRSNSDKK